MANYQLAIKMFNYAIPRMKWQPEIGQAYIFLGDCYRETGEDKKAIECYIKSIEVWDIRREPFFALGSFYDMRGDLVRALIYYQAAYAIEFTPQGYLNDMALYGDMIPNKIAMIYGKMRKQEKAKEWWVKALNDSTNKNLKIDNSFSLQRKINEAGMIDNQMRVLNVGIGDGKSGFARQLPIFYFDLLAHVEINRPYIETAKRQGVNSKEQRFMYADIRWLHDFKEFNTIFCFDVLEHMPKEDSLKLLEGWKDKNIFVFIPLEKEFMVNDTGNMYNDHKSLWTEKDFLDLGFKTELLKGFHKVQGKEFDALWAVRTT